MITRILLTCALCMASMCLQAATPSTKSFRGTGGILVTSNDATAVITIDGGSVVASGTNSTIRTSTNGTLLTVSTQVNFGYGFTGVVVGSTANVGLDPSSVVGNSTNAFGYGITNMVVGNVVFMDATVGNDSTGKKGDASKPFKLLTAGVAAMSAGDVLYIRPGTYNVTNQLDLPDGASIVGQSRRDSIIKNWGALGTIGPCIWPGNGTLIANVRITNATPSVTQSCIGVNVAIGGNAFNDVVVDNCELEGETDIITYLCDDKGSMLIQNSTWRGKWDGIVVNLDFAVGTCTNSQFTVRNCEIIFDQANVAVLGGLTVVRQEYGNINFMGCRIVFTNAQSAPVFGSQLGGGNPANLNIQNCSFESIKPFTIHNYTAPKVAKFTGCSSNNIAISDGLRFYGPTYSRALVLNSSGDVTNAAGTPDGTKFLRDDNTYAVPAGSGSGNFSTNAAGAAVFTGPFTNKDSLYLGEGDHGRLFMYETGLPGYHLALDALSASVLGLGWSGSDLSVSNDNVILRSLTASRPLFLDSSKKIAPATGTPNGTKFMRDDGALANTAITNSVDYLTTGLHSGYALFWDEVSQKWTAYGQYFYVLVTIATTNYDINVATNSVQSQDIVTGTNFTLTFVGTPLTNAIVNLAVHNTNSTMNVIMTNNSYDTISGTFATNNTYSIASNSMRQFQFQARYTFGTNRWELISELSKQLTLSNGANITFTTNGDLLSVSATASGNSGAIQFNQGGNFAGTNTLLYDRTNDYLKLTGHIFAQGTLRLWGSDIAFTNNLAGTAMGALTSDGSGSLYVGGSTTTITPTNLWLVTGTNGSTDANIVRLDANFNGGPALYPYRQVSPFTAYTDLGVSTSTWRTVWTKTNRTEQITISTGAGDTPAAGKVWTATGSTGAGGWSNAPAASVAAGGAHYQLRTDPFTSQTLWVRPIIDDEFEVYGVSINNTLSLGAGASSGNASSPDQSQIFSSLPRNDYNGFIRFQVFGTNGVGSTHSSRLLWWNNNARWAFTTNNLFDFRIGLETANASNIIQIGFSDNTGGNTNITKGVVWEWNPQFYGQSNWVFKCVNTSTMLYTSTFPHTLNTWQTFGWKGDTNTLVAYTNGVACFTNTTVATIPGGQRVGWNCQMFNGQTNGTGSSMTHDMYLDYVKAYRY